MNWADGWRAAEDLLPAGSGLGTYRYIYRAYQQQPYDVWYYHAENQYLQALVEAGLPGLGLLLAVLGLVALACWRLLQHAPDAATYALGVAGTFALSSQAIHAVFDFGLYLPANMLLLALICGAVCGRAARIEGSGWRSSDGSVRWPVLLVALPPLRPWPPRAAWPWPACCCWAVVEVSPRGGQSRRRWPTPEQLDLQRPQSVAALDRCLSRFAVGPTDGVQDVEAQLKLAQLWTNRMRVGWSKRSGRMRRPAHPSRHSGPRPTRRICTAGCSSGRRSNGRRRRPN